MSRVRVLQIKKDAKDRDFKIFRGYDRVVEEMGKIDFNHYYVVWDVFFTEEVTLEELFEICNCYIPDDYEGHSMSVSDIVEIDGISWYCDVFGWKAL